MLELKLIHEKNILMTRKTANGEFNKLFRILQFRIFLSHFDKHQQNSGSFTHKKLCGITVIFAHFQTQNSAEREIEIKQLII